MGEGDLTGVLSLKQQFSNNSIAVFTDVKNHVQWIREQCKKYQ
jgi:hypothetical protein